MDLVYWISSILIGWVELGYQLIYLLWPNMVNEHSTTKWAESFFFPVRNPARKTDEKNHFGANLNKAENPTASHWDTNQNSSGVPDFLGRQETVYK